jgi:alpha-beta hydrolase superfamily lysophospholipase
MCVRSGFWEAYSVVREFVHSTLRKELLASPHHVYFTGHSLGGALATLAALDTSIHTIPRVNAYFEHKR